MFFCKVIEKLRMIFSDTINIGNFCGLNKNLQTRLLINHTISKLIGLFWFTVHANLRNFGLTFIRSYFRILCLAGFTLPPHTLHTQWAIKILPFLLMKQKLDVPGSLDEPQYLLEKKSRVSWEQPNLNIPCPSDCLNPRWQQTFTFH